MGLDTVELVMEFEKYFGIQLPDSEVERASTVQEVVDLVAKYLNVTSESTALRERLHSRVNRVLMHLGMTDYVLPLTDNISRFLDPGVRETWEEFGRALQLDVPKPAIVQKNAGNLVDMVKRTMGWIPTYDWSLITIGQFVDVVCTYNYEELIDCSQINSTYEIYIAVAAITVEKLGVDYYEIAPEKSFVNDFGAD